MPSMRMNRDHPHKCSYGGSDVPIQSQSYPSAAWLKPDLSNVGSRMAGSREACWEDSRSAAPSPQGAASISPAKRCDAQAPLSSSPCSPAVEPCTPRDRGGRAAGERGGEKC